MNWIDAAIILTLAWFTYAAFHAGMIREIVTILGAIMAVVLAGRFYQEFAKDVGVAISNVQTAEIVAFAIIFFAVILATQLIAMLLKTAASVLLLGVFDSFAGAFIGLAKGLIFVEIALIFAITFPSLGLVDDVEQSAIAPLFLNVIPFLQVLLPERFETAIENFGG